MLSADEGRVWGENWARDPNLEGVGYGRFKRSPLYMGYPAAADLEDRRHHTSPLLFSWLSSSLLASSSSLHDRLDFRSADRPRASALSWRCFHVVRR
jgi:hypothetical protein